MCVCVCVCVRERERERVCKFKFSMHGGSPQFLYTVANSSVTDHLQGWGILKVFVCKSYRTTTAVLANPFSKFQQTKAQNLCI